MLSNVPLGFIFHSRGDEKDCLLKDGGARAKSVVSFPSQLLCFLPATSSASSLSVCVLRELPWFHQFKLNPSLPDSPSPLLSCGPKHYPPLDSSCNWHGILSSCPFLYLTLQGHLSHSIKVMVTHLSYSQHTVLTLCFPATMAHPQLHLQRTSGPWLFALASTAEHFHIIHLGLLSLHVMLLLQHLHGLSIEQLRVSKVQNKPCHFTVQEISCGTS